MKTFSISIPKPCHEDWNKMTPDAKGAFCGSCRKSVYDFSKKTDEEIIAVFEKEEKGKVCGRFAPAQLSRPVVSFGNSTATNLLAKFAYALLLVFGATLFSGEAFGQDRAVKGETQVRMMGKPSVERVIIEKEEVEITDTTKPFIDSVTVTHSYRSIRCGLRPVKDVDLTLLEQAIILEETIPLLMGDTIIVPKPEEAENVPADTLEMMTGEVMAYELPMGLMMIEPIDTTTLIDTMAPVTFDPETMVAGGVSYIEILETSEEPTNPYHNIETVNPEIATVVEEEELPLVEELLPEEEDPTDRTGLVPETILVPSVDFQVKVSPNPSRGEITLSYSLTSEMPVRIDLHDNSGKMIRNLSNAGKQSAGKYNAMFNIADLPNGTYTAIMITADRKVSAKVILTK